MSDLFWTVEIPLPLAIAVLVGLVYALHLARRRIEAPAKRLLIQSQRELQRAWSVANELDKLVGITVGMLTVQLLNLARIISLFYLGQWNKTVFEWAHLYLWQALIMLDVLFVFLLWLRWLSRKRSESIPMQAA